MLFKPQFLTIAFLFLLSAGRCQNIEVGLIGGGTYYLGDLNPSRQFLLTSPAYGAVSRINFDDRWALRINFISGELKGNDSVSNFLPSRGLSFQSKIKEISALMEFNFFEYFTGSRINYVSPFLFAGPGVLIHNPYFGNVNLSYNDPEQGFNMSTIGMSFIFGMGCKYSVSNKVGVGVEWGMRRTFTDYIDGVSKTYNENSSFDPTGTHQTGMQRGNSQSNDWYSFAGITITYRFNLSEKTTCSGYEYSQ